VRIGFAGLAATFPKGDSVVKKATVVLALLLVASLAAPAFGQADKTSSVSGTWKCVGKREGRPDIEFKLVLTQNGTQVTGTASRGEEGAPVSSGSFENGKLKFQVDTGNGAVLFEATLAEGRLSGTIAPPGGATGIWTGVREGSAAAGSGSIAGTWKLAAKVGEGSVPFTLELKQEGGALAGKALLADGRICDLTNISFADPALKFTVVAPEGNFELEGKLAGDKLSGTYQTPSGARGPWEGTRAGGAAPTASASIRGKWKIVAHDGARTLEYTMELKQEGDTLSGRLVAPDGQSTNIASASFSGNKLKFTLPTDNGNYLVEGQLEGDKLTGTYTAPSGRKDTWEGKRL